MAVDDTNALAGYTLRGKGEIRERLSLMQKKKCLLRAVAKFDHGEPVRFLTTILRVLPEKSLLVLDSSYNYALNAKLVTAREVTFDAQVDGVQTRFSVPSLTEATCEGQAIFVTSVPDSLFWLQRRQFYRLEIPLAVPVHCQISSDDGGMLEFNVSDISLGGLAVLDKHRKLKADLKPGDAFAACALNLPGYGAVTVGLEVRNITELSVSDHGTGRRIGCAFTNVGRQVEVALQKFLYDLELRKKRTESLTK